MAARPCGFLYLGFTGTPEQQLEQALDQAARVWACEVLLKGTKHPDAVDAGAEHMRLSMRYCRNYLNTRR